MKVNLFCKIDEDVKNDLSIFVTNSKIKKLHNNSISKVVEEAITQYIQNHK